MNLLIVTTEKDRSCNRIIEEAEKRSIHTEKILYSELDPDRLKKFDFCIPRFPYPGGEDFSEELKKLLTIFKNEQMLDCRTYKRYPDYEDKLFQHRLFKDVQMPKFWYFNRVGELNVQFPALAKRRISGKCRDLFILNTKQDLMKFLKEREISEYIFEEVLDIEKDIRVIVLGDKIVGAVERSVRVKDRQGFKSFGVKIAKSYEPSEHIKEKALEISKRIGADFCGIDFVIDKNGKMYLIECNLTPEFVSSERVLDANIAGKLMDFVLKKHQTKT